MPIPPPSRRSIKWLALSKPIAWLSLPTRRGARAAAYLITMVEGAALHLQRLKTRAGDFDPEVRDRLIAGAMLPGAWIAEAQKFRRIFHTRALALFRDVDVLLAPATPCPGRRN